MTPEIIGVIMLSMTVCVHLIATVWWAASVTKRIEHAEKWIADNARISERFASLEARVENIGDGIDRIEHLLRHR